MSSVTELEQEVIGNYITVAAGALFFYESLTTLSREVDVIWSRKWTMMTWLYAFTRYSTVADEINLLMPVWNFTSCKASVYIDSILHLIRYLSFACFSALRVYALLNENIGSLVAGIVMLLDLVPFATNMFNAITIIVYQDQETCAGLLAGSDSLHLSLSLATRISVIIGDVLVLVVTWIKTAQAYKEARLLNIKAPLVTMLFRDGTIYFIILLLFNVLQIVDDNIPVLFALGVIQPFFEILQPIIVCHFILNLRRQIGPAESPCVSSDQLHSLRFRVLGNIGHSLQISGEEDDEQENKNLSEAETHVGQPDRHVSPGTAITAAEEAD